MHGAHEDQIDIIEHLPACIPKANPIVSIAKAYACLYFFSRFPAKAVKHYPLNRISGLFHDAGIVAETAPLHSSSEANPGSNLLILEDISGGLIESEKTDGAFAKISDIARYDGLLDGDTLIWGWAKKVYQIVGGVFEQSLARLLGLADLLQQIRATVIRSIKERDVRQTANLLRQCVGENLRDPGAAAGISDGKGAESPAC